MKIAIFGGDEKFASLISLATDGESFAFDSLADALDYTRCEGAGALFILPHYGKGEHFIPEFSDGEVEAIAEIVSAGKTKVYIENYPSYDYRDCFVFGLQARAPITSVNKNSICLVGKYKDLLGFEILQKRGGYYYPNAPHIHEKYEILAEIRNCLGVHTVVECDSERSGVALLKTSSGVYCSMADLTYLRDNEIFLYKHWCDFYKTLFSEIIGSTAEKIESAFCKVYEKPKIRRDVRPRTRRAALESAVFEAIKWHTDSGMLVDGGRGGVYEMIRSFDLGIAKNVRGDSSLFTAALFMAAARYFDRTDYKEIAENIAKAALIDRDLQITEGKNRGLFKWFSAVGGLGPRSVYVSDSARVGNSLLALYRLTENEEYGERVRMLGEALLRWFGGDALLPGCDMNYELDDLDSIQDRKRLLSNEFYDAPIIFLGNLYSVTGDERYREQIIKTAERLANAYPNYETVTSHSDSFTYSRLLGTLAVAQRFGDGAWTPVIDKILLYFKGLQHSSGGFFDGKAYFDEKSLSSDVEFAVGFGGRDGHIADMVYCQNTLAYSLNILLGCEGGFDRALAEEMQSGLIEFLLDSQISSTDKRFSGAWMRAFDMDNMEYYGCDKDFAWGPYCILTGWVTGAIPLVFLDLLGLKTMY